MKPRKTCLGGFPAGHRCTNAAGCRHSPYWCEPCNQKRMEAIDASMERIRKKWFPELENADEVKL